jgi:hypothetical protein
MAPACQPLFMKVDILGTGQVDDHPVPTGFVKEAHQRL